MKIKFFLKRANDLLAITSLLRLFHSFTTLLLKEYFAISSLTLFFVTLVDDLLNWILIEQQIYPHRCHCNFLPQYIYNKG